MSLYNKHIQRLASLQPVFGFNPAEVEQGTKDWLSMKIGVLSASKADCIVAGTSTGKRSTYMASLINQICSCSAPDEDSFRQLEHGKKYEDAARDALAVALGFVDIKQLPFMFYDEKMRVGVSPDGVFGNTIVELKCPHNGENFIKFECFAENKKEWKWQSQFQIFAGKAEKHIFAQYDPRMILCKNLSYSATEISDADQKTLADAIPQFISDMDKALDSLGVKWGDHFEYLRSNRS